MTRPQPTARFLASVTDVREALAAVAGGADIVDAKAPGAGALGALPVVAVAAIRAALPAAVPLSATIGDLPPDAAVWRAPAEAMAGAGADVVKIGVFPGGGAAEAIRAIAAAELGPARLVGVLLADRAPDIDLVRVMAEAGFRGVMLDTAGKDGRALPDVMPMAGIARVVAEARAHGLECGLAGSLGASHVETLAALGPDIVGFRGALTRGGIRTAPLDVRRVAVVREAIDRAFDARARAASARAR